MNNYCPICGKYLGGNAEREPYLWRLHKCDQLILNQIDGMHAAAELEGGRNFGFTIETRLKDGFNILKKGGWE